MEEIANRLQLDKKPAISKDKQAKPGDTGNVSVTARAEVLVAKFKSNVDQPAPPPIRRLVSFRKSNSRSFMLASFFVICVHKQKQGEYQEQIEVGFFMHRKDSQSSQQHNQPVSFATSVRSECTSWND